MYKFKFSDIGDGVIEGKILELKFKVGDEVNEGDVVAIVETDKVNAELPSPVKGTVVEYPKKEGEMIYVGESIVIIDDGSGSSAEKEEKEPTQEEKKKKTGASVIGEIEVNEDIIESSTEKAVSQQTTIKKALATPVARNLAKNLGLNINEITGTGPNGRVTKDDILKFSDKAAPVKPEAKPLVFDGDVRREPLTSIRKTISAAMTQSQNFVVDTVLFDEVVIDHLVGLRNRTKDAAAEAGVRLTFLGFISKAVIETLKEFPLFNASYDHVNEEIIYKNFINLGFAVDTPKGLIVPNIKNAQDLSIFELAKQIDTLAKRAVNRTVQLDEIKDGTFSITNFGSLGVPYGTPVINYPEVAILGIGKIDKKAVVEDDEIKIRYVLPLSLAVDHRIIDGADAGRFIIKLKSLLKDIELLLLS